MPDSETSISREEVQKWFRLINLSKEWKRPYEERWDRTIDYLRGKYFNYLEEEDQVAVNMVRPHVNTVIPAIYSRNPDIIVYPGNETSDEQDEVIRKRAEVMQRVLRYYLKELGIKGEAKLCILDAILTGHGWMKTGYETLFRETDEFEKETLISQFLKSMGMKEASPEDIEEKLYPNEKIVSERPWALRVSPYDMFVPALTRRMEESRGFWERTIVSHEEVLANKDYNTEGLNPSANANELLAALRGAKYKQLQFGNDIYYDILWEIWDPYTNQIITLCEGHDEALQVKETEYTMLDSKYHPYVQLRFNEVTDEFYCQGDIDPATPQIEELNEVRSKLSNHMRRFNRAYKCRPGALSEQAKKDLKVKEDGLIIEIENTYDDRPLEDIITPIQDAPIAAEVYAVETRVKDDLFTIFGTSDYASQASGGARTATEAQIIATQSRFKVEERIDQVGEFVERIIRNIAQIALKYVDMTQVEKIVGEDAIYWIQEESDEAIRAEFNYKVVYASTTPINREVEEEQFLKRYAIMKDDPYFNQVKLRLELVRKANMINPETWLNPQIAQEIEKQRMLAVKRGFLMEGAGNASGSIGRVPRGPKSSEPQRLPTGQPRGIGAARPAIPGGRGGTALEGY